MATFIIDCITGRYHGMLKPGGVDTVQNGKKQLQVRTMSLSAFGRGTNTTVPYLLEEDVDIVKTDPSDVPFQVWFLRDESGVAEAAEPDKIWERLSDSSGEVKELKTENKKLQRRVKELERKLDEKDREDTKKESSESSSRSMVQCRQCGKQFSEQRWRENLGACPNETCNGIQEDYV